MQVRVREGRAVPKVPTAADAIKWTINRAYAFCEEQQRALDEGRITEEEWFAIHERFFTAHYLAADNPRAQSGHGGDEAAYRYTRGMLLEAIHRSGALLDIGCANGYLLESLQRWLQGTGLCLEFHGLDISAGLLDLARRRMPHWGDRFHLGNALHWSPATPFDFVCLAELGYVPRARERELLAHLWCDCVAAGGRLILGPYSEERQGRELEDKVRSWGHVPSGYCAKSHQRHAGLCRRMLWFDKPAYTVRQARPADLSALTRLKPPEALHRDRLREADGEGLQYLVVERAGSVVGFGVLVFQRPVSWPDAGDTSRLPGMVDLLVQPDERGKGAGSALIGEMERLARARGQAQLYLGVDPVDNPRAHQLYLRLGYTALQDKPHYEHWRFADSDGNIHEWDEWSLDMVKEL